MEAFGFTDTVVPVLILLVLAICAPVLTVPPRVASQRTLAQGMVAALVLIVLLAAALFAELYRREGNDVLAQFLDDPGGRFLFFLSRAAMSGMFWGPVVAFVWFGRALEVERRKGEARAKRGGMQ